MMTRACAIRACSCARPIPALMFAKHTALPRFEALQVPVGVEQRRFARSRYPDDRRYRPAGESERGRFPQVFTREAWGDPVGH